MMEQSSDEDADRIKRRDGTEFERRIANEPADDLRKEIRGVIKSTVSWPSTSQSLKGPITAGFSRTIRYVGEKMAKYREGTKKAADDKATAMKAAKEKATSKEADEKKKDE